MCQCRQWPLFENKFPIKRHFLTKVFKQVAFLYESFQTSGLCLKKVFKWVVFVWRKFSIFLLFISSGLRLRSHCWESWQVLFSQNSFWFHAINGNGDTIAIPFIIQWQYHGNYHLLKMTLVKGVASLLLNWNHALSLQMYCQSWAHIFTKICLSF